MKKIERKKLCFQAELADEAERKRTMEDRLVQLQQQYEEKCRENAQLLMDCNKKDELNSILESKELELMQVHVKII